MRSSALLLSAAALAAGAPTTRPVHVGVARRSNTVLSDGTVDLAQWMTNLNKTLIKYHHLPLSTLPGLKPLTKRAVGNEALLDDVSGNQDELYYGSGQTGSEANTQTFTFDFDTGSSDTFVPGPQCGTAEGCTGTTKYNQQGTDRHNTTSITYGSGAVAGENYLDDVTIAGLTAHNQNIISLTTAQGFSSSDSNSLMGMAFQSIANSASSPYFQTLMSQGIVSAPEFSFYLGRDVSGTGNNSQMTLGGRDSSLFSGPVTQVPVTQQGYWQVALDGTTVNGKATLNGAAQAAIDTGTTIVLGPTLSILPLFLNIPGAIPLVIPSLSLPITFFLYPCAEQPQVALVFAGTSFAINDLDFNGGSLTEGLLPQLEGIDLPNGLIADGYCIANVAAADINPTSPLYIVGDTFLKNWYSIFSHAGGASVSFAKAV